MNDLDPRVRESLDGWRLSPAPDWEDVLRRARERRRLAPGPRTALLLGVALLLAAPALGVGGRLSDLLGRSDRPGLRLGAALSTPGGAQVGSLSLRTSRLFVSVGRGRAATVPHPIPHPFAPRGSVLGLRVPLTWTLQLGSAAQGGEARLERTARDGRRHVVARLCTSCPERTSGRLRLGRASLGALFSGRVAVVVTSGTTTARGVVRLQAVRG
jgi:hypothetical protein